MNRVSRVLVFSLAFAGSAAAQPRKSTWADAVLTDLDSKAPGYGATAKQIWGFAEVGYQEEKSSALLQDRLRAAGFSIEAGVGEMPTAFVASYGSGKPVIAIVGEFDALPGLSQDATPVRKVLVEGGPGHGCGHHLFGTANASFVNNDSTQDHASYQAITSSLGLSWQF